MATVSRLKKATRDNQIKDQSGNVEKTKDQKRESSDNIKGFDYNREKEFENFIQIAQKNPSGITPTVKFFPYNHQMNLAFNVPLAFFVSPMISLQNQGAQYLNKSIDVIPRCSSCLAYMNCHNTIQRNKFRCFMCNRYSHFEKNYQASEQTNSSIYQAIGSSNFYSKQPTDDVFVFILDITPESYQSRMIYYFVAALKQALSENSLDNTIVVFYTFDEVIHQYDFAGEQVKRVVMDQSMELELQIRTKLLTLKQIRAKLFDLLDALEQISSKNYAKGYNFGDCFKQIFTKFKSTGCKFFVFQSSQVLSNDPLFLEEVPTAKVLNSKLNDSKSQSFYQSKNKKFFEFFVNQALSHQCSVSFFSFSQTFKNLRVLADAMKLTNSQIKIYSKDSPQDLDKFYYELIYYLTATYFRNLRVQFLINVGWQFTGIYTNSYRIKQSLTYHINYLESSRKIVAFVSPTSTNHKSSIPFCSFQLIVNYRYKRQHFVTIATFLQPVTSCIQKLYQHIDAPAATGSLTKKFLSNLRMEPVQACRQKHLQIVSKIYYAAIKLYKSVEKIPLEVISIIVSSLAMLKSFHGQPQLIVHTQLFDLIVSQRNFFQFSGQYELSNFFNPYLFDLNSLTPEMCIQGQQFIYPPTIQAKFDNVKHGLYILDNGVSIYLYIGKQANPELLRDIFGIQKIGKNEIFQQNICNRTTQKAVQVMNLIRVLRQQKYIGWAPLYIVRQAEDSGKEKNFYLNFYLQKYEEYKIYRIGFQEYIELLVNKGKENMQKD